MWKQSEMHFEILKESPRYTSDFKNPEGSPEPYPITFLYNRSFL